MQINKRETVHRIVANILSETIDVCRWYPKFSIEGLPNDISLKNMGSVMWLKENPITVEQMYALRDLFNLCAIKACKKGLRYETRLYSNRAQLFNLIINNKVALGLN